MKNKIFQPITIAIISITVVAFILRVYQSAQLVRQLNRDEAALAYNSFLLQKTGKDEWGVSWPITPKSFGDSKLIGYHAILVGLFSVLPYEDWVVRLPSVFFGSLLVLLGAVLVKQLGGSSSASVLSALSITFAPVLIHFSRFAYEAVVALFLYVAACVLLFASPSDEKKRMVFDGLAAILIFLSLLTYNTPLLITPFLIIAVPFVRNIRLVRSWIPATLFVGIAWLLGVAVLFPMLSQKSGISIFSDETILQTYPAYRANFNGLAQSVLGNQYVFYANQIISRFVASFNPTFLLFSGGAHPWHSLAGHGHLTIPILAVSIFGIIRSHKHKLGKPLLFLLLTSLVPASITVDAPHATRSLFFFFLLAVYSGLGFDYLRSWILKVLPNQNSFKSRTLLFWVVTLLIVISGSRYYFDYISNYPIQAQVAYQLGFNTLVAQVESDYPEEMVAVVDPGGYQYISAAWYSKLDPETFFSSVVKQQPTHIGLQYGERVGRYHFIAQESDRANDETILITWNATTAQWDMKL